MSTVSSWASEVAASTMPVIRTATKSLLKVLALGTLVSFTAMIGAASIGWRRGDLFAGVVAALLVALIGCLVTPVVAVHHAVFVAVESAVSRAALGSRLFQVIFDRVLGGAAGLPERGARLGAVGQTLETRIPLAQAEERLKRAVLSLRRERPGGQGGWLWSRVQARVFERIEVVTLSRFRATSQSQGAVDLVRVRDELGQGLDGLLADQIGGLSLRFTLVWSVGAALAAALATALVYRFA